MCNDRLVFPSPYSYTNPLDEEIQYHIKKNWSRMVTGGRILLIQDRKIRWMRGEGNSTLWQIF